MKKQCWLSLRVRAAGLTLVEIQPGWALLCAAPAVGKFTPSLSRGRVGTRNAATFAPRAAPWKEFPYCPAQQVPPFGKHLNEKDKVRPVVTRVTGVCDIQVQLSVTRWAP